MIKPCISLTGSWACMTSEECHTAQGDEFAVYLYHGLCGRYSLLLFESVLVSMSVIYIPISLTISITKVHDEDVYVWL